VISDVISRASYAPCAMVSTVLATSSLVALSAFMTQVPPTPVDSAMT
jgi:hypothetical protein